MNLHTNVEDMAKWSNNFYTYKVGGKKLFNLISKPGQLNNGQPLTYGFGLELKEYKGLHWIGHAGGIAGYNTMFITFPNNNLSITILANLASISSFNLSFRIADILLENDVQKENKKNS